MVNSYTVTGREMFECSVKLLTNRDLDKMFEILQMSFSNAMPWIKTVVILISNSPNFLPYGPVCKLILNQVMAWCHQVPSHYIIKTPKWVNSAENRCFQIQIQILYRINRSRATY